MQPTPLEGLRAGQPTRAEPADSRRDEHRSGRDGDPSVTADGETWIGAAGEGLRGLAEPEQRVVGARLRDQAVDEVAGRTATNPATS